MLAACWAVVGTFGASVLFEDGTEVGAGTGVKTGIETTVARTWDEVAGFTGVGVIVSASGIKDTGGGLTKDGEGGVTVIGVGELKGISSPN